MPKYIIEVDSDHPDTKSLLMVICEELVKNPAVTDKIGHTCVWEDDGSTFVSKGLIFDSTLLSG